MNPFGSRDEDPLLQNDPLAPPPDDSESEGGAAVPEEASSRSGEVASGREESSDQEGKSRGSASPSAGNQSVFSPSDGFFAFEGQGDTRVVVRSAAEASEGRLTVLNTALSQGWRLVRVELREDAAEAESSSDRTAPELAFVLRQPEAS